MSLSLGDTLGGLFPQFTPARPRPAAPDARQKERAADHRRNLAKRCADLMALATTPEEMAAIEALYESLQAKPAFTKHRSKSVFCPAPTLSLDRNALARIKFQLQAIRRGTWFAKEKGKHSGGIAHSVIEVFEALVHLAQKHGKVFPSLVGIGILATRSKQTVVNALKVLEHYGFITRIRRIKCIQTALGPQTVQDTNAYTIQEPNLLGRVGLELFGGTRESRSQAAREPDSYSYNKKEQGTCSIRAKLGQSSRNDRTQGSQ